MGSYQLGIDRCLSAIVENNHDDKGIIWPISVAPFKVVVIVANMNDHEQSKYANNLYNKLTSIGVETFLDDRKETIGVKFNDADLIGYPIRVTVGKMLNEDKVEVRLRSEESIKQVKTNKIIEYIQKLLERGNR